MTGNSLQVTSGKEVVRQRLLWTTLTANPFMVAIRLIPANAS